MAQPEIPQPEIPMSTIRRSNLPLSALRTFEVAARHLSFKLAADELCVSATTVSNQIRRLEKDLNCKLFIRRTRAVDLTEAGHSLSQVLTRSLNEVSQELARLTASEVQKVTLAVGPVFGARWMIPRLARFRKDNPNIDLKLVHGPRILNSSQMSTDIAVDWGYGSWSGLEASRLMDIQYAPVISPALLAEMGGLNHPKELARFPLIHQYDESAWQSWLKLAGCEGLKFKDETTIMDTNVVIQAVTQGLGVALGQFPLHQAEIDSGQLVCPFDIEAAPKRSFYLLSRPGARTQSGIRQVCNWLDAEAQNYINEAAQA
ncbi:LysR substrate-binding domain-containing protein [Pseudophaeobacter sp.]|uniref:LysR substrate-binding domain-containing protein n=1 Tax=Pseudophaeobacter sp. TaxID=1971739 RepID=UPI003298BE4E